MVTKRKDCSQWGLCSLHVEGESYALKNLVGRLQGRAVGKPGCRWWENIKTNIKERGCEAVE